MSEKVHKIFSEVYKNYDMVNTVCSLGTIVLWRRTAAAAAMIEKQRYNLLDIATGTGGLAFEIFNAAGKNGKKIEITGVDFSGNMLKVARQKAKDRRLPISFQLGDAMELKYPSNHFDVVTSAFALRNVDSLETFAREAKRVMKRGARFVFMDMARPDSALERAFLKAFWTVVGGVGFIENPAAYKWLMESVDRFNKQKFFSILKKNKFRNLDMKNVASGAAFMVTGNK